MCLRSLAFSLLVASCALACGGDDDGGGGLDGTTSPLPACEGATLIRVDPEVVTGAGGDELGDADTDGNGILDRDEWGELSGHPQDWDFDGLTDYEDVDDDGDGLLDVYDDARLEAVAPADWLEADQPFLASSAVWADGEQLLFDAAREGDTLRIEGRALGCDSIVVFQSGAGPIDVVPDRGSAEGLEVVVPAGASGPITVVTGGWVAGPLPVRILAADAPVLYRMPEPIALPGQIIRLSGANLGAIDTIVFGSTEVDPQMVAEDRIELRTPETARGFYDSITVRAGDVESNAVPLSLRRRLAVEVAPPSGVGTGDLRIVDALHEPAALGNDGTGTARARVSGPDLVRVIAVEGDEVELVYSALALPADSSLRIDARSTAIAMAYGALAVTELVAFESMAEARTRIAGLAEVSALGAAIDGALSADPGAHDRDELAYASEVAAALIAARAAIDGGLADGSLRPAGETAPDLRRIDALIEPMVEEVTGTTSTLSVMQIPDTGNVVLTNDTRLPMSVRIIDNEWGRSLHSHISGYFDGDIVAPQDGFFGGYGSKTRRYDQPRYRDVTVEVVTAGLFGDSEDESERIHQPTERAAQAAQRTLRIQAIIEGIVWPIVSQILGETALDDVSSSIDILVRGLVQHYPELLRDMVRAMQRQDVDGAIDVAKQIFERERSATPPFPMLQDFYKASTGRDVFEDAGEALGGKAVGKAVGGAIKIIGILATALDAEMTLLDLLSMKGVYNFDVIFGMGITEVTPDSIERGCRTYPVSIEGAGFYPRSMPGGALEWPFVEVVDSGPGGAARSTFDRPEVYWISSDGTELQLTLDDFFVSSAIGPVYVQITHRGEVTRSPLHENITVDPVVHLASVSPRTAMPGEDLTLSGRGFTTSGELQVVFEDASPPDPITPTRVFVPAFTSMSDTELRFPVPMLPDTVTSWNVRIRVQQPGGCAIRSERLPFSTRDDCLVDLTDLAGERRGNALDVNDRGDVVFEGITPGPGAVNRTYVYRDGRLYTAPCQFAANWPVINDMGTVAGRRQVMGGPSPAAFWNPFVDVINPVTAPANTCVDLPVPMGPGRTHASNIRAINDDGIAFGTTAVGGGVGSRASYWKLGVGEVIPRTTVSPGGATGAAALNNTGDFLGADVDGLWLWREGEANPTQLLVPMGAVAMSDDRRIAGTQSLTTVPQQSRGVVWDRGAITEVGGLGFPRVPTPTMPARPVNTRVTNMSDDGRIIIGRSTPVGRNDWRAWVHLEVPMFGLEAGTYDLNDFVVLPGTRVLHWPFGVNNRGQIAVQSIQNAARVPRAYLLNLLRCSPATPPGRHPDPTP